MKKRPPDKDKELKATILPFPRKRGRPKILRPKLDYGTPELRLRRMRGDTAETLDLCLERGLITEQQHWCGIHLRWLYTLRHGAPGVRAIDPTHLGGIEIKNDDPEWRKLREQEYHEAITKLGKHMKLLMNICVYNERPGYLREKNPEKRAYKTGPISDLSEGLDLLAKLWCKPKKR